MRRKWLSCLLLGTALVFTGCVSHGGNDQTSSSGTVDEETDTPPSSVISDGGHDGSDDDDLSSIAAARSAAPDTAVSVKGVVVRHAWAGQENPYKAAFWLADETGSIYVYGPETAQSVNEGDLLTLSGKKAFYVSERDMDAAKKIGYKGMNQIVEPTIISNDGLGNHPVPDGAVDKKSIAELARLPLTDDVTGTLHRVRAHYARQQFTGYVNYNAIDPNWVDEMLVYTASNGKDYAWTDEYDGKTVDMLISLTLAKPALGVWRISPLKIYGEVTIPQEEEVGYAAWRALNLFQNQYYSLGTTVRVPLHDSFCPDIKLALTADKSEMVTITTDENDIIVTFLADKVGEIKLTATASAGAISSSTSKTISIVAAPVIENVLTLKEAREKEDGTVVRVKATVARVTYKGSMAKQGLFLIDETSSLFCYNDVETADELSKIENGNGVILEGTMTHFRKPDSIAILDDQEYSGDHQLTNATVLLHDANVYPIASLGGVLTDKTIADIVTTLPKDNISSNAYRLEAKVIENLGGYGGHYLLQDPTDAEKSLLLYSQNGASDFKDLLHPYADKTVELIVGIQNIKPMTKGSAWRGVPLWVNAASL